ncbi:MAG TPA: VacJ family lipoprotein [Thermohalobaculum sp.]|nr:VacJ family lipoprotein [Thermohalobaculum sp.]
MTFIATMGRGFAALALLGLASCASADPDDLSATDTTPGFNRAMHGFNLALDRNVLRPAAQGYDFVTPTLFKHLIGNGFSHLELPGDFVNYLLQGRIEPALETLGRFSVNTVVGAGGLLDPATEAGLPKRPTDFGITLGRHGVAEGNYLVLPLFGPSTTRDAVGTVVDRALHPLTYLGYIAPGLPPAAGIALNVTERVDARNRNADVIDDLLYESEDSYISLRSVYLQRRRALVAGEEGGADALPDIFDQGN